MPDVRRSSFSTVAILAALGVSGCVDALRPGPSLVVETSRSVTQSALAMTADVRENVRERTANLKARFEALRGSAPTIADRMTVPSLRFPTRSFETAQGGTAALAGFTAYKSSLSEEARSSSRCREMFASAGAQATILRSPTIGATANTDDGAGVSVSFDFLDLQRARLTEAEADARCRRYLAATKVSAFLLSTNEALTEAGYRAKAESLARDEAELDRIEGTITRNLDGGIITIQAAEALRRHMKTLSAAQKGAEASASRRAAMGGIRDQLKGTASAELIRAQRDLAAIDRMRRTVGAWSVSASGAYNTTQDDLFGRDGSSDLRASFKVSVRTGALLGLRQAYEDEAERARVDSLYDPGRGQLWQLDELRHSAKRTIENLEEQRHRLKVGLASAKQATTVGGDMQDEGLVLSRMKARIDAVLFRADLAAVDATLQDTRRTVDQLNGSR